MLFELKRTIEVDFFLFRKDNLVLTVKRGRWRGLPGGIISQSEDCIDCALRIMSEFANLERFGGWSRRITEDGEWDKVPARLSIVEFPNAKVESLRLEREPEWTDIYASESEFDVTIDMARRIR